MLFSKDQRSKIKKLHDSVKDSKVNDESWTVKCEFPVGTAVHMKFDTVIESSRTGKMTEVPSSHTFSTKKSYVATTSIPQKRSIDVLKILRKCAEMLSQSFVSDVKGQLDSNGEYVIDGDKEVVKNLQFGFVDYMLTKVKFSVNGVKITEAGRYYDIDGFQTEAFFRGFELADSKAKSTKDSDALAKLAYEFGQIANYFDRANSPRSRNFLAQEDEVKYNEFLRKGIQVKAQLQREIEGMTKGMKAGQEIGYFRSYDNKTLGLLLDAINRLEWTSREMRDNNGQKVTKELEDLYDKYKKLLTDGKRRFDSKVKDNMFDDAIWDLSVAVKQILAKNYDKAKDLINGVIHLLQANRK